MKQCEIRLEFVSETVNGERIFWLGQFNDTRGLPFLLRRQHAIIYFGNTVFAVQAFHQAISDPSPEPGSLDYDDIEKGIDISYFLNDGVVTQAKARVFGIELRHGSPRSLNQFELELKNLLGMMGITFVLNAGEDHPGLIRLIGAEGETVSVKFS